jgi:hypothetical protein
MARAAASASAGPEGLVLGADLDTVAIAVDTEFCENRPECSQRTVCRQSKSSVNGGLDKAIDSTALAFGHATGMSDRCENQPLQQVPLVTAH